MKASTSRVDSLPLSTRWEGTLRRRPWRPGLPRLSAALPFALGLLCLLLALRESLRFSGDLLFHAEPGSTAAESPAGTPPAPEGDSPASERHSQEEPGAPSTGCDEGPAQVPAVASLELRAGSPHPTAHAAGALPSESEATRSPPRLSGSVAWAAVVSGPLSAAALPFLPRAPPHA